MRRLRWLICLLFEHPWEQVGSSMFGDTFFCPRCKALRFEPIT